MDRVILHCDCNSFFASVELLDHPELAGRPVAVAGDPESRHGIILAKNELAKSFGVRTAETIYSARAKCPSLVCLPPHMHKYHEVSQKVNAIYLSYTDLVEPFSVDESYLDVTGSLRLFGMTPRRMADDIRGRVRREIGITISVGVSFCKVFAKLGSDYKKPDATTVFGREELAAKVYPMSVRELLFVGKKTAQQLEHLGILTIGQLAQADEEMLRRTLGEQGAVLRRYARGTDEEPVHPFGERREQKSVGNGATFRHDLQNAEQIRAAITMLSDEVAYRLREMKKKCTVVQVSIRDHDFRTIQRQRSLDAPTWLLSDIIEAAVDLVLANRQRGTNIRMLTVTAQGLVVDENAARQMSLFEAPGARESRRKEEKLEQALMSIRRKKGMDSIYRGVYRQEDVGISNCKSPKDKSGGGDVPPR